MCGVVAIFNYRGERLPVDREELQGIRDSMNSRGPDGAGEWYSEDGRIGLGHRRLAIIDLSEKASQPLRDSDSKLVVSFNGEIYNYRELRAQLEKKGRRFRTQSDTEVLLHLYQEEGEAMLGKLRGMFAFVLWDPTKKALLLARDPYGIKPLYYADDGRTLRAASQVQALLRSEKISKSPEPAGRVGFFLMGSVPEPFTLYKEICQVPAGSYVWVNESGPAPPRPYFSIREVFEKSESLKGRASFQETVREALLDSVRHHFVSDVPVGIFLSGGLDSGALVALAHESKISNLQTISLAFEEFRGGEQDEAPLAEEVAQTFGTRHHTRFLSLAEFKKDLPRVFKGMDQPTIDGINTYWASRAAREKGLKVALSGLGGDELFGGYSSFQEIPRLVQALRIPSKIPFLGEGFRLSFDALHLSRFTGSPKYAGLFKYGGTYPGAYFLKRGLFLPWELESLLDPEVVRAGLSRLRLLPHIERAIRPEPETSFARIAILEASFYMRNQLLRDADWAGMAHSLEIRTPFVDAWLLKSMTPVLTGQNGKARCRTPLSSRKPLLTQSLHPPLPEKVLKRSKTGFTLPMDHWLKRLEEGEGLNSWRRIPLLRKSNCPWARRWAWVVFDRYVQQN